METFDQSLKYLLEHEPGDFVRFALKDVEVELIEPVAVTLPSRGRAIDGGHRVRVGGVAVAAMRAYIRDENLMQSVLHQEIFAKGELKGLRQAITDLCEVLGIELTPEREAQLRELDLAGLTALRTHLKRDRAWWPGGAA